MSTWGHFAGIIRIARDPQYSAKQKHILRKVFNNIKTDTKNDYINFPKGSEGPLKSKIITQEWEYVISLYGDLRNYTQDDLEYAKKWWKNIEERLNKYHLQIIQSILNIKLDSEKNINILVHNSALFGEEDD